MSDYRFDYESEIALLRKALEYYADKDQWREHWFRIPTARWVSKNDKPAILFRGYEVAERALALKDTTGVKNG